jgi:hypothetical protein
MPKIVFVLFSLFSVPPWRNSPRLRGVVRRGSAADQLSECGVASVKGAMTASNSSPSGVTIW